MIVKGDDIELVIHVIQTYENAFGKVVTEPINLTEYEGYIVILYSEEDPSTIIDKFSLNTFAGYGDIVVIDAVEGIIQVNIDKDKTKVAPEGMVYGLFKTNKSNVDFSLDAYLTTAVFPVDEIVETIATLIVPPGP